MNKNQPKPISTPDLDIVHAEPAVSHAEPIVDAERDALPWFRKCVCGGTATAKSSPKLSETLTRRYYYCNNCGKPTGVVTVRRTEIDGVIKEVVTAVH